MACRSRPEAGIQKRDVTGIDLSTFTCQDSRIQYPVKRNMSRPFSIMLSALAATGISVTSACTSESKDIFEAVHENDSRYVSKWLANGGNPNQLGAENESLLYIATGPHGGNDVLEILLKGCADPNRGGAYGYTPLMNAGSWVNLAAVELLLEYGADPKLKNSEGKTALDVVGRSGGAEKVVIERLRRGEATQVKRNGRKTCHSFAQR